MNAQPSDPAWFIRWLLAQPRRTPISKWLAEAPEYDELAEHELIPELRRYYRDTANSRRLWAAVVFSRRAVALYQGAAVKIATRDGSTWRNMNTKTPRPMSQPNAD